MDEWIDRLEEEDIYAIGQARNRFKNVPTRVDKIIFDSIEREQKSHVHHGFQYRRILSFAAAAIIIMLLIPVFLFFMQYNSQLNTRGILMSGAVSVKEDGKIKTL
jgi:hypothetical protein